MENEVIFSLLGIIALIIVIFVTLKKDSIINVRSSGNKKMDIIDGYKQRLNDELVILKGNKEAMLSKKSELLKEFNMELSHNIFFDKDEIRKVILELSQS